jgi:D-alanyl-D-alanine carboxypeptidase
LIGISIAIVSLENNKSTTASASNESGKDNTYITKTPDNNSDVTAAPEPVVDKEVTSFKPAQKIDKNPSSITVYVNREYALSKDYKPKKLVTPNIPFNVSSNDERTKMRPEAAKAIEKLFAAANRKGLYPVGVSGYRSYARQYQIFTNNLVTKGKEHTLKYSAIPGTSEHQTGLVMDCSSQAMHYDLRDTFINTPEGKWLAKNAYKYGFIIRYPKDKANITGYAYEPWHIRYVGRGLSYYLYDHKLTLDEYYKYKPSPDFDYEQVYAAILNYVAPRRIITATPTAVPTISPTTSPTPTPKPKKDTNTKNNDHKDTNNGDNTGKKVSTPTPVPTKDTDSDPTVTDTPQDNPKSSSSTKESSSDNAG